MAFQSIWELPRVTLRNAWKLVRAGGITAVV